jgi:hypothetical protein
MLTNLKCRVLPYWKGCCGWQDARERWVLYTPVLFCFFFFFLFCFVLFCLFFFFCFFCDLIHISFITKSLKLHLAVLARGSPLFFSMQSLRKSEKFLGKGNKYLEKARGCQLKKILLHPHIFSKKSQKNPKNPKNSKKFHKIQKIPKIQKNPKKFQKSQKIQKNPKKFQKSPKNKKKSKKIKKLQFNRSTK